MGETKINFLKHSVITTAIEDKEGYYHIEKTDAYEQSVNGIDWSKTELSARAIDRDLPSGIVVVDKALESMWEERVGKNESAKVDGN